MDINEKRLKDLDEMYVRSTNLIESAGPDSIIGQVAMSLANQSLLLKQYFQNDFKMKDERKEKLRLQILFTYENIRPSFAVKVIEMLDRYEEMGGPGEYVPSLINLLCVTEPSVPLDVSSDRNENEEET